jgi:hypothetical protein
VDSTVVTRVTEWRAERGSGALELSPRAAVLAAQVLRTCTSLVREPRTGLGLRRRYHRTAHDE